MEKLQILTERQQTELNHAIIQYLQPLCQQDNHVLLDQLSKLLNIDQSTQESNNVEKVDNYLEKDGPQFYDFKRKLSILKMKLVI